MLGVWIGRVDIIISHSCGARFSVLRRASARRPFPWAEAHGGTLKRAPHGHPIISRLRLSRLTPVTVFGPVCTRGLVRGRKRLLLWHPQCAWPIETPWRAGNARPPDRWVFRPARPG